MRPLGDDDDPAIQGLKEADSGGQKFRDMTVFLTYLQALTKPRDKDVSRSGMVECAGHVRDELKVETPDSLLRFLRKFETG